MSRITQKACVGALDPFRNISTGVSNTAFSAIPATGAQPTTGVGTFEPDLASMLGQKFDTSDGRELALVKNGAVAIPAATVVQCPAESTTVFKHLAMTVPAAYPATAGLFQIKVTNGSTVLKVNEFAGGYVVVAAGTGLGQCLKIASHEPAANGATFIVTLEDPIQLTLDATSTITLQYNLYDGVLTQVASGSTQTGTPVGISLYNLPASTAATYNGTTGKLTANGVAQYGLIVTHGPAAATITTTTNIGYALGISTTAGALITTPSNYATIASSIHTQTTTECGMVYLML